jgi:aminobenzoyl-glutamate utilization protein B
MHCTAASKSRALSAAAIAAFLVVAVATSAQEATEPKEHTARIEAFKASVIGGVEARRKLAQVMNDTVFSFGELAYQEFETSKYLTAVLEKDGFAVERGVAGIPTAWVAPGSR